MRRRSRSVHTRAKRGIESLIGSALKSAGISRTQARAIGKRVLRIAEAEKTRVKSAVKKEAKKEVKKALKASKREVTRMRLELRKATSTLRRPTRRTTRRRRR